MVLTTFFGIDLITVQSSATKISCVTSLLPLEGFSWTISQEVLACVLCVLGVGFVKYSSGTRLLCRDSYYLLYAPGCYYQLGVTTSEQWDCSVGIAINYCMHWSCFWSQHLCRLVRTQVLSWRNPIKGAEQGHDIYLHTSRGLMPFRLPLLPFRLLNQKKSFLTLKQSSKQLTFPFLQQRWRCAFPLWSTHNWRRSMFGLHCLYD